jgi:hypothetical protein
MSDPDDRPFGTYRRRIRSAVGEPDPNAAAAWAALVPPSTRNDALDALGAALSAAEKRLFEMNLGVEGGISILSSSPWGDDDEPSPILRWGKFNGEWCLYVEEGRENDPDTWRTSKLLQASADVRRLAAHALPELLKQLRAKRVQDVGAINEATQAALAFVRGEFDSE